LRKNLEEEKKRHDQEVVISEEALKEAEKYIEEEEGPSRRLTGKMDLFITFVAVIMSLVHLYAAIGIIMTQVLRGIHVMFVLFLSFLVFPSFKRFKNRILWWDFFLAVLAIAPIAYMLADFEAFIYRSVVPTFWDQFFGIILILLILEATRRTTGWVMPVIVMAFLAYTFMGPQLPKPWTHREYDLGRVVGHMYMTLEGIFGVPIDVSSTFIILFTIWGAFLELSGAGKFFIDFSFAAMGGKPTSAGRTVTLASFLLGGPSGSGVATTVTLGSVAYPMLAKAGYSRDAAGGLLSAGGIGAILSPPVLGAAAFLIAEFLKISYLDVIIMAAIPTCLYTHRSWLSSGRRSSPSS
jgi:TRAP transporter 4TM/12TM fusion protein